MMYTRERKRRNDFLDFKKKKKKKEKDDEFTIEDFVNKRDFSGGAALMEVLSKDESVPANIDVEQWLGYCYFHLGEYNRALEIYEKLLISRNNKLFHLYIACCHMATTKYNLAMKHAEKGPECPLKNRLLLHSNDKLNLEEDVMVHNDRVGDGIFDQLSLACIHLRRGNINDAIEIHRSVFEQNPDFKAMSYYLALDYFHKIGTETDEEEKRGVSYLHKNQHFLQRYLESFKKSLTAVNLLSCTTHKMETSEEAEEILQRIVSVQNSSTFGVDNLLLKHNLVVFSKGDNALKVLPNLIHIIPEAKLNLISYYLRTGMLEKAHDLMKLVLEDPSKGEEYVAKATVLLMLGQQKGSQSLINEASSIFRTVGASETECNTLHGRLSWTQYLFLNKDYKEVVRYLSSIEDFMESSDEYHWNFAIALVKCQNFRKAEKHLLLIKSMMIRNNILYNCYLIRAFLMNNKPEEAWDVYLNLEKNELTNQILPIIANDSYRMGHFSIAMKSFDLLERLSMKSDNPDDRKVDYWKAKRGSIMGVFQQIIAGKEKAERLTDLILFLTSSRTGSNDMRDQEIDHIVGVMKQWASMNDVRLMEM